MNEVESFESREGTPSSTIDDLVLETQTVDNPVAQVNGEDYASLKEAIEHAPSGSTITLMANDTTSFAEKGIVINEDLTIEGNGNTIKGNSGAGEGNVASMDKVTDDNVHGFYIKSGNVTINNLTMTEFGDTGYVNKFGCVPILTSTDYTGTLTLSNVNIDKFNRQAVCINGGTFAITGGMIDGNATNKGTDTGSAHFQQGIEIRGGSGTIDGTMVTGGGSNLDYPGIGIVSWSEGNVTLNNVYVNYTGIGVEADYNTVSITGDRTSIGGTEKALFVEDGGLLNVGTGSFSGELAVDNKQGSSISITGGMCTVNPNDYVADGYGTIRYSDTSYRVASTGNLIKDVELDVPAGGLTYNGTEQKPTVAKLVNVNGKTFTPESPVYPEEYENNVNAGTATAMVDIYSNGYYSVKEAQGSGNIQNQDVKKPLYESATITKTFSIAKLDLAKATVTVDPAEYTYDGKAKEPTVTVTYDGKVIPTSDYKVTYESNVEAGTAKVKISAVGNNTTGSVTKDFTIKRSEEIQVKGKAHVQKDGDKKAVEETEGAVFGTTGESKRMESTSIELGTKPEELGIEYRSHVQTYGWESGWAANGAASGTTGQSKRLEAVRVRLTGELADHFDVWYRVHCQTFGWSGWAKNGEDAGTSGLARRTEAIEVVILPKEAAAPGSTEHAMRTA